MPTCCAGFEVCPSVMIAHEHISRPRRLISTSRTPAHQTAFALSAAPLCAGDTWRSAGVTLPMGSGVGGDLRASQKHVHHMTGSRGILAVFEVFPPSLESKPLISPVRLSCVTVFAHRTSREMRRVVAPSSSLPTWR